MTHLCCPTTCDASADIRSWPCPPRDTSPALRCSSTSWLLAATVKPPLLLPPLPLPPTMKLQGLCRLRSLPPPPGVSPPPTRAATTPSRASGG